MSERIRVLRYVEGKAFLDYDGIAVEEPLRLTIVHGGSHRTIYIMRTPIDDRELAVGFLFTQGIIGGLDDIEHIEESGNFMTIYLAKPFNLEREFMVNSSCGVCGAGSLPGLILGGGSIKVHSKVLIEMPRIMAARQRIFSETGGLHAAGAFNAYGDPLFVEEDVGRHNAVDKLIGKLLIAGIDPRSLILQVSGRVGYEIAEKAAIAGFPIISAISAPTTSAVQLCELAGISLVGFVRGSKLNVYSHPERIMDVPR
ncbi:sulfurtransferase FdhD [Thermocladium modestius]|uniref:Sulfur carrier protein FdhD n=1 Tax=Thermocladium modestius TaxID=62609 RepID=A0A830GVC2_9CREN|nr:formate dehydrogenase accessory sulfurtransferase FdhD [Thermocladium modestius]GGP20310.1 sulfurtransferase FdhD [Thermocladium modestius]